jgi:hypothetical protein
MVHRNTLWRRVSFVMLVATIACAIAATPAFAATIRVEQSSPLITYSGTWTPSNLPGHSGGSVAYTTQQLGATATLNFTGTGVDWIAAKWYNRGIGEISIDGGAWRPVDQYAAGVPGDTSTVTYQAVVYRVRRLANGPHTVSIRLTANHNPAASSPYLITLDAFDVVDDVDSVPASSAWSVVLLTSTAAGLVVYSRKRRSA